MRNNGSRRGSKKERDHIGYEGGRMTRNGLSANHLLNFTLPEREKQPNLAAKKKKNNAPTRTQMEYLHANYRFVIAPLTDDTAISCWDMETLTEWNSVEQVLLWNDASSPATCPICLDQFRAPKITRCGHIFCWPCILRYLSLSDKYWRRCPMCFDAVQKGQLRSVRLDTTELPPRAETQVTFQFLQRSKASLFPYLRDSTTSSITSSSTTSSRRLQKLLPTVDDAEAKYARIVESTHQYVEQLALRELKDLETLDAECRSCGDTETLPFVEEAMKATSGRLAALEALGQQQGEEPTTKKEKKGLVDGHGFQHVNGLSASDLYTFYQQQDGCYVVLHPLNIKCLTKEYADRLLLEEKDEGKQPDADDAAVVDGAVDAAAAPTALPSSPPPTSSPSVSSVSGSPVASPSPSHVVLPDTVCGRVIDVDHLVLDDDVQKRFRFLSHLPKFCDFYVCELDLSHLLSSTTTGFFKNELKKREKQRRAKKDNETSTGKKKNKKKTGAASPGSSPVLSHFGLATTFSLEQDDGSSRHWPAPGAETALAQAVEQGLYVSDAPSFQGNNGSSYSLEEEDAEDEDASFATITRNSGYYPPLGGAAAASSSPTVGSTWGSASAFDISSLPVSGRANASKKKGNKGTPLFSTAQRRSYR